MDVLNKATYFLGFQVGNPVIVPLVYNHAIT